MKSSDRVAVAVHTCPKCFETYQAEKQAVDCCDSGATGKKLPVHVDGPYSCGDCGKGWTDYELAGKCCKADHVKCPLSDLPDDAYLGHGLDYNYGKAFTGNWELVWNKGNHKDPVRVYPLPPLVAKMVEHVHRDRYEQGTESAQKQMRIALGIHQENANG